ncbi:cupin domain-containing protein [Gloeothece verrucosa]|uniref:Cupin 2 conserved barrel domain protein n=1 Tax=Gloeothece verrucosa (strain PCC 7822) TaxID=497965 RepID=E0UL05_GLOV7|nr:cupin domain-containing protein [Gloeothece verrucosa]ADN17635.1 Cupin 2 conserved barrel domain protein [Gloeothece verrucosa PCC 7822]
MCLPLILQPGEGPSVQIRTSTCTFKVTGKDTKNHFGLFEFVMEPGTDGASPHIHKQLTEIFYVVEGQVELILNQERISAAPGALMLVPENTPHGFSNPGTTRATLLIMFCPADSREQYFEGLAELTKNGRQPSSDELLDLMHRFDQYPVPQ